MKQIFLFVAFAAICMCDQPGHQDQQHIPLHDRSHVADKEHIMEHLDGVVKKPEEMTEQELQFHYFKMHDTDRNNMLDGLELVHAMTHFQGAPGHPPPQLMPDDMLSNIVDSILGQDDRDKNGLIDYVEFAQAQGKRAQIAKEQMEQQGRMQQQQRQAPQVQV